MTSTLALGVKMVYMAHGFGIARTRPQCNRMVGMTIS